MNALVLGGGIAGLAHAHQLKKKGYSVALIEESAHAGGVIRSEKINGHLLEFGPNTVLPTVELMDLIRDVGLSKHLQIASAKSPRYVLFKNKLHPLPLGPVSFLTTSLLSFRGKFRLLMEPFISRGYQHEESLYDFSTRRLGIEATERLLAPFVAGVWAADARELSVEAAFPKLAMFEQKYGSVIKGLIGSPKKKRGLPKGLLSFPEGLETLSHVVAVLLGNDLHLNEKVLKIERNEETKKWVVGTERGVHLADRLVSSLPAYKMAELTRSWAPALSHALEGIPYISLTMLHLSVPRSAVRHSLNGFGYLVVPTENEPYLGCLFSSSLFPNRAPSDRALLTVFIRGEAAPSTVESSIKAVSETLGISAEAEVLSQRIIKNAIPQYTAGHLERMAVLAKAQQEWPELIFIGNYLEGISVGDVVRHSVQKAA